MIQPQVPLRLPCYDFTPITDSTLGSCLPKVSSPTSGRTSFRGVTGGVYKTRERIHRGVADPRLLAIPASWSRVADSNPNWGWFFEISSLSRVGSSLCHPLYHVCSPGRKGHEDLTSSPPSSDLTSAVSLECPT